MKKRKMKNLLLLGGIVFLSFNVSAQNGWVTQTNAVTGQKYIYKNAILDSGTKSGEAIKIWKEGDSYYFAVIFSSNKQPLSTLEYYDKLTHEVRVNGEWKSWWYGRMYTKTPIYESRLKDFKNGDMLKLDIGIKTIYVNLSGSTAAINSL